MINATTKNQIIGPLLTALIITICELLAHTQWKIPNAPAIIVTTVIFSGFVGGLVSSLVSGFLNWIYIAYFFSLPDEVFHYDQEGFRRVVVWAFVIPTMAIMVGRLKKKLIQHERVERDRLITIAEDRVVLHETEKEKQLLEKNLQVRDEFISLACHELNTPLTSIKLQTQMAKRKIEKDQSAFSSPEQAMKLLSGYDRQVDRLTRLVESMLDISRMNALGEYDLKSEMFELTSFVDSIIKDYSFQTDSNQSEISFNADSLIYGLWDPMRLEQVIVNLLSNAIKYGEGKPINISIEQQENKVIIIFKDNGIGIAQEDHQRIFDRFERAVKPTHFAGLGIGLFLTKQIVTTHHGTIAVDSELGKGATFIVELPLTQEGLSA